MPIYSISQAVSGSSFSANLTTAGTASYVNEWINMHAEVTPSGINPILYFTYIKKKFRPLERMKLERRLKEIESAFDAAVENGQDALAKKFLKMVVREARESVILAKGVTQFIEKEDLEKFKYKIRGGHISDTPYEDFTRIIPKKIVQRRKELEGVFDAFVIYHYFNPYAKDLKALNKEEKQKMRDPVLFGTIREETDRLYFIAEWEDDYCDLSFSEMVGVLGKSKAKQKLTNSISFYR